MISNSVIFEEHPNEWHSNARTCLRFEIKPLVSMYFNWSVGGWGNIKFYKLSKTYMYNSKLFYFSSKRGWHTTWQKSLKQYLWINYIVLFSVFLMCWHLGPQWHRKDVPPRVSKFPKIVAQSMFLICKPTNSKSVTPTTSFYRLYPPPLNHPGARYWTTRSYPYSPVSWNYSNYPVLSLCSLLTWPCPFLPAKNTIKAPALSSVSVAPFPLCVLILPWCFPVWLCVTCLFLEACEHN